MSARCCWPAGLRTPWRWPSGCAGRRPTFLGRLNYSVPRWRVGPPLVPVASTPLVRCWSRRHKGCPLRMPPAGGIGITSRARLRSRCVVRLTTQPPRLPRSTSCDVPFGRWTMRAAWPGRGWPRARAPSVEAIAVLLSAAERAAAKGQFAAEVMCLQTATQFGDRSSATQVARARVDRRGATCRPGGPVRRRPAATATALNWLRCQKNSSRWVILLPPSTRPPTPPWRIAARTCGDRRWVARHAQMRWPNNAAELDSRRFVRPASPCR